jgi:hypothetical protein
MSSRVSIGVECHLSGCTSGSSACSDGRARGGKRSQAAQSDLTRCAHGHPSTCTCPEEPPGGASTGSFRSPRAEAEERVGTPRRPIRVHGAERGRARRAGARGTVGHGDTVAEASIRHPRSNVLERVVQRTHIAVREYRRHARRRVHDARHSRDGCSCRGEAIFALMTASARPTTLRSLASVTCRFRQAM